MNLVSAATMAQAALTLLQDESTRLTGGVYTPACLGQRYVSNLEDVGFKFETEVQELK